MLTRIRPRRLNQDVFAVFDDLFAGPVFSDDFWRPMHYAYKPVQSTQTDKGITVSFQVPGYGKEDLELSLEKGVLTLCDKLEKDQTEHRLVERIRLPKNINEKTLSSTCTNGVVTVTVEFAVPKCTKQIIKIT